MQYGIPLLQVDAHELQQVLLNLIMNAADAMRPVVDRSRILRITSEVKDSQAILAVHDTGVGIAPENIEKSSSRCLRPRAPAWAWACGSVA
jgi:C4-dicarboxylate-specific signal transduction histidine kinase